MPPSYEHVVWKKTSLLHRLMYCAIKLPMLKRIVTTTLKGPFFRENPFVKCCGVEADRDPRAPKQMRTHCLVINKADLAAIHKAATSHGASLLGAVYAAATQAICEQIIEAAADQRIDVATLPETAVNLPGALKRDDVIGAGGEYSPIATLMYLLTTSIKVSSFDAGVIDFWAEARKAQRTIRSTMATRQSEFVFMPELLLGECATIYSRRFNVLLHITNLGNCGAYLDRPRDRSSGGGGGGGAGVKVTAQFSAAAEQQGGPIFTNALVTLDDKLCWTLSYTPYYVSKHAAIRYHKRSVEILMQQCR